KHPNFSKIEDGQSSVADSNLGFMQFKGSIPDEKLERMRGFHTWKLINTQDKGWELSRTSRDALKKKDKYLLNCNTLPLNAKNIGTFSSNDKKEETKN